MQVSRRTIFMFLWPWLVGLIFWTGAPILTSLALSFSQVNVKANSQQAAWVGLSHYREAIGVQDDVEDSSASSVKQVTPYRDDQFRLSLVNSLVYTVFAVPLGLCSALSVALLLNKKMRGMGVIRTLVYLPHVLGGVATIVIWSWMLNPQYGWVNEGLRCIYLAVDPIVRLFYEQGTADWTTPNWLYSAVWCKPSLVMMHVWTMGPGMLVFLAALQRVPLHERDASLLDGAGAWHRFRYVTWPHLTPAVLFNLIVGTIFSMQSFTEPYMLQHPQQQDGLLFYMLHLYQVAFEPPYRLGYACALAWIFFVVIAAMVTPMILASRRWVYEAGMDAA